MSVDIRVVEDPQAALAALLGPALASRQPVVLTGGSTVKAYARLAPEVWDGAHVFFSDERCVLPSDERSNYGALLAAVGAPAHQARIERMRGEAGPDEAAEAYEQILSGTGAAESGFELILLGLGPDGHICSMFPGQKSLEEDKRLVVGVPEAGLEPFVPRVTLTFPALAKGRHMVLFAAGANKADAVAAGFAEDAPVSREVPVSLLSEWAQRITVLTDEDGASRL